MIISYNFYFIGLVHKSKEGKKKKKMKIKMLVAMCSGNVNAYHLPYWSVKKQYSFTCVYEHN